MAIKFEIAVEDLRKVKLFVATPMYGGIANGMYAKSMMDLTALCTKYGMEMRSYFLFNESLITRARNYCVDEFMRSGYTHLLFIDADIAFNPNDVIGLIATQISDPENKHVVAAPYPKKCITWEKIKVAVDKGFADEDPNRLEDFVGDFVFNPVNGNSIRIDEPAEVAEAGTGFMLIPKATFERYQEKFPEYWYKPDHVRTASFDGSREIMSYFDCYIDKDRKEHEFEALMDSVLNIGTKLTDRSIDLADKLKEVQATIKDIRAREAKSSKRYLSEDYMFCQNVRYTGMKVWLCPWMQLKHTGFYTFGGQLAAMAAIGASATADPEALKNKK